MAIRHVCQDKGTALLMVRWPSERSCGQVLHPRPGTVDDATIHGLGNHEDTPPTPSHVQPFTRHSGRASGLDFSLFVASLRSMFLQLYSPVCSRRCLAPCDHAREIADFSKRRAPYGRPKLLPPPPSPLKDTASAKAVETQEDEDEPETADEGFGDKDDEESEEESEEELEEEKEEDEGKTMSSVLMGSASEAAKTKKAAAKKV